jgi:hypothetical protein
MSNSRISAAARKALVASCIAITCVSVASECGPTATAESGVYGDPAAAKYWQEQSLEDNCGLMAVADVVGEITGNSPTERQMIRLAEHTPSGTNPGPIYAPRDDPSHSNGNGGIEMADEVVLLDHYGIKSVMAWVNSAIIWHTNDQRTNADHFLVVTGIDTNKEIVHLNDPGVEYPDEQVSITTFTSARKTGEDSIVVTSATS